MLYPKSFLAVANLILPWILRVDLQYSKMSWVNLGVLKSIVIGRCKSMQSDDEH